MTPGDAPASSVDRSHGPRVQPGVFAANTAALQAVLPKSAEHIEADQPPDSLTLVVGRDGTPTYAWTDQAGRRQWLGRTTMPAIRAEALVSAFQDGGTNCLLYGIGQGETLRRLLLRLAAHQAVMVIEPTSWTLAAVLRLYDFAEDIERRRLTLFVGPEAWEQCRGFLDREVGFLCPQRVLSWPWFDAETIAMVSDRLAAIQSAMARSRASGQVKSHQIGRMSHPTEQRAAVAIVSQVPDPAIHRLARRIEAGARGLDVSCQRFVLDDPRLVRPLAIEKTLAKFEPTITLLLDTVPGVLSYSLPKTSVFILWTQPRMPTEDWLDSLPRSATLGVRTERQQQTVIRSGLEPQRVVLLPPAAMPSEPGRLGPGPTADQQSHGGRILVWADAPDPSADAAGLHLTSHCRLWKAAGRIIRKRVDSYLDEDATSVLAAAERSLRIHLDSDEVRDGIVERICERLGPGLVRRAYCTALAEAGLAFDLCGEGWDEDDAPAGCLLKPRSSLLSEVEGFARYGALVFLDTSGILSDRLLDGLAAGRPCLLRRHPLDKTPDGLAAALDPAEHVVRFGTRGELVRQISRFLEKPEPFVEQARQAAEHVHAEHTWTQRIQQIMEFCGARP